MSDQAVTTTDQGTVFVVRRTSQFRHAARQPTAAVSVGGSLYLDVRLSPASSCRHHMGAISMRNHSPTAAAGRRSGAHYRAQGLGIDGQQLPALAHLGTRLPATSFLITPQ